MSYQAGINAFKSGDYHKAIEELHQATEEDDQNHRAWNALGVVLTKNGDFETADTCYQNALTLAPDTPAYQRNRDKNRVKWQAGDVIEVEEDDLLLPSNKQIHRSRYNKQRNPYKYEENVDVGKAPFWLGLTGFIFGILFSLFLVAAAGFFGAFGISGSENFGVIGSIFLLLSIVGFGAVFVKHKQYAGLILLMTGILVMVAAGGFAVITGLLYIVAGILIFRKTGFHFLYYFRFGEDSIKKSLFTLIVIGCLIITAGAISSQKGVTSSNHPNVGPTSIASNMQTSSQILPVSSTDFSSATHASVMSVGKSWDADAENDGIIVYPDLKDSSDQTLKWENAQLPVDVEIWTIGFDKNFKPIQENKVFGGTGTIMSWRDGNFLMGPGIKIPYSEFIGVGDTASGRTRVNIHLPDGRTLEAIYDLTPLKP